MDFFSDVDPDDDPIGTMRDVVTLPNVTVTNPSKKKSFGDIFNDIIGGVNKIGNIKLPRVETGVENKSVVSVGVMLVIVVIIYSLGRRRY